MHDPSQVSCELCPSVTFGIVHISVQIDGSIADMSEPLVHDVSKLTGPHWARHTANEDGFAWIRSLSRVTLVFAVCNEPWPDLHLEWGISNMFSGLLQQLHSCTHSQPNTHLFVLEGST